MAYLARAGFDVFSVDMTGYGRSTRPAPMNDPCNLRRGSAGRAFHRAAPCTPSYPHALTDDRVGLGRRGRGRGLHPRAAPRGRVSLVAWSLGGPRAGGYAAQQSREGESARPARARLQPDRARRRGAEACRPKARPFNTQSRAEFDANWDRQVGCPDQYDRAAERRGLVRDARRPIRSARRGGRACAARRRRRPGAGTRRRSPRR